MPAKASLKIMRHRTSEVTATRGNHPEPNDLNHGFVQKVFLKAAEECVGFYKGFKICKYDVSVILSLNSGQTLHIWFPRGSREEEIIRKKLLSDHLIGQKIGIIKLDCPKNPILIRTLVSESQAH